MSYVSGRIKGKVEELAGRAKTGVGRAIGNERMQIEGTAKHLKGKAMQEAAKARGRVRGSVERVTGAATKRVGVVLDDAQMQAEGKLEELTGAARKRANR
jgi:uncharacterized protein YjbJ (UPF0337 family)